MLASLCGAPFCLSVFREVSSKRPAGLQGVLHQAPAAHCGQWRAKRVALLDGAAGKTSCQIKHFTGGKITWLSNNPWFCSLLPVLTGVCEEGAYKCFCDANRWSNYKYGDWFSLHFCWSLPIFGWRNWTERHIWLLPVHQLLWQGGLSFQFSWGFLLEFRPEKLPCICSLFLSSDVVPEQLWEARVGCSVCVRAGDEEAGRRGEGHSLDALLAEGNILPLAQLLSRPHQHRSDLQAGHQGG